MRGVTGRSSHEIERERELDSLSILHILVIKYIYLNINEESIRRIKQFF